MQSYIEGLAKGIFSYDVPQIIIENDNLDLKVKKDEMVKGMFTIKALNDRKAEGFVYSSSHRMTCLTPQFCGNEASIMFEFNSMGLKSGTTHNGKFSIISNAGEIELPYQVTILQKEEKNTNDSMSLEEFAKLSNADWYEAYKLFSSEKFNAVLKSESEEITSIYQNICGNGITMQCMEEFLIGINAKERMEFSILENDECFENVSENFKHVIKVKKNTWGYLKLIVEADSDFITIPRNVITTEEFIGSSCNIEFFVNYEKLHAGINFGRIAVYSPYDSQEYVFTVNKGEMEDNKTISKSELKNNISNLLSLYTKFRLGEVESSMWTKASLEMLNRISSLDGKNDWYKLMKAMVLICNRQREEAGYITDRFQETHIMESDLVLWAFYLYVMTLYEEEEYIIARIKNELNEVYKTVKDNWIVNWIILQVDDQYIKNSNDRYRLIRECLLRGNNSPILYTEAAITLCANPILICNPEKIDICILNWMKKHSYISVELGEQFLDQLSRFKRFQPEVYRLADYICKTYDTEENVRMMCSYLIRMDKLEPEYNHWYKKGIEYDLKITRLYEYYIISIDEFSKEPLPKIVYMYFRYNSNIDNRKKAFLYANLIANKDTYPEIFRGYQKSIEQFMNDQFYKGVINENMAIIYNEFFYSQLIMEDTLTQYVDISSSYKLVVSDGRLNKVTVIYDKLHTVDNFAITGGKAIIHLYSKDYRLIFSDGEISYISDVEYSITPFVNFDGFLRKALRIYKNDEKLITKYFENKSIVSISKAEENELKFALLCSDNIKEKYKSEIREELINYYFENDDEFFEEELLTIPVKCLSPEKKICYVEILLRHRYYEHAYKLIKTFGFELISTSSLLKLATFMIEKYNYEPREFLTFMCFEVYSRGMYNQQILKYLNANYFGNTTNLNALRKTCEDFEIDTYIISEKLIKEVLFTGAYLSDIDNVFDKIYKYGTSDTVRLAYLHYYAYSFLIKDKVVSDSVFEYIYKELITGENVLDICKLALMKYLAEKEQPEMKYKDVAKNIYEEFYYRNINLKCLRKLAKYYGFSLGFDSKCTIEYITNPEHKVDIHFIFDSDDYVDEEMKNVIDGIFVKEITMFFGENVQYYITEYGINEESVVESGNIVKTEVTMDNTESSYDLINDMYLSLSLKDDVTTIDLMKQYDTQKHITEKMFTIM